MSDKEFIEMMIDERINVLLSRKVKSEDAKILEEGEGILSALDKEKRDKIERFLNLLADFDADNQRTAYIGGFKDGLKLSKWVKAKEVADG